MLHAILGELPISSGNIDVAGRIAYSSQEPWVFSGTIRQNILFGQPYNEKRYNEVLKGNFLQFLLAKIFFLCK